MLLQYGETDIVDKDKMRPLSMQAKTDCGGHTERKDTFPESREWPSPTWRLK